jgi:lysophospholipase L1-like esterase
MYRFQIIAQTQPGESIALVGAIPKFGQWDEGRCLRLRTSADRYPLWWVDVDLEADLAALATDCQRIEYKYLRLTASGTAEWEEWGTNRWIPTDSKPPSGLMVVDDGQFSKIQPWPYGYLEPPLPQRLFPQGPHGLKVLVLGSSVALGCNAWLLNGWASRLAQTLGEQYGHQVINGSELGANVTSTIARFSRVVTPVQPDIVIIALSLGNEGLAYCAPYARRAVQRRFEGGLQQLIKMTRELGAYPILGGLYPHGDYTPEHTWLLQDTHQRMLTWGVPVLDWLGHLNDGQGRWRQGMTFNPAHPNTEGQRLMYEAIDLKLFDLDKAALTQLNQPAPPPEQVSVYRNQFGFSISACPAEHRLRIINGSAYPYTIDPDWADVQAAIQLYAGLTAGFYIAEAAPVGVPSGFAVSPEGKIVNPLVIPSGAEVEYRNAVHYFAPEQAEILFYDGQLALLKESNQRLRVINESDHEYNLQPMWKAVRNALQAMPTGVYHDPLDPDAPFRTLMIGAQGLESRVKAPAYSTLVLEYKCALADISRVAILPLGDRCAVRMLLYKLEYDGPAFPFDLTRTTKLGDVADMIESRFYDLWNPALLHYSEAAGRIYHARWSGLSFAHEVEETDDPLRYMTPVYERMRERYSARAERFWYTLDHCDKVLFIRTGVTNRGEVIDLLDKLTAKCQGKSFRVLILSPQTSDEFADLTNVVHYNVEFNPDHMYADLGHWLYCTDVMRGILTDLGVSSQNLFWCPPNPPKLQAMGSLADPGP